MPKSPPTSTNAITNNIKLPKNIIVPTDSTGTKLLITKANPLKPPPAISFGA